MIKVRIVVEGHDYAEVEFPAGQASQAKVHGGDVPAAVLQQIAKDLAGGFGLGEVAEFKWQRVEG